MEYLFENPIPLLMVGLVLLTFSGVLYFTTRSIGAFMASVVILVLILSSLVMEQIVYTERELIEASIAGICGAAERNDIEEVRSYLSPTATETREMIDAIMPRVTVEAANVYGEIEVELDDPKQPTTATARFEGIFRGQDKQSGLAGGQRFPVEVGLVRGEHRWLIESFTSDRDFEQEAAKLMK